MLLLLRAWAHLTGSGCASAHQALAAGKALSGVLAWSSPTAGTRPVTVIATDSKTGLSGQGVVTLAISAH